MVYPHWLAMFRKGFYQIISAHTGTGYMTIYAPQFANEWGALALLMVILAMGLVLLYTTLLYTMNLLVDLSYAVIDPRVELD